MTRQIGTLTEWNEACGFGWIKADAAIPNTFVHKNELARSNIPAPPPLGTRFAFDVVAGNRHARTQAGNLELVK